nr:homolog of EHV2 ORF31 protein UL92 [Macronycteris gammaherpesvirus 1]
MHKGGTFKSAISSPKPKCGRPNGCFFEKLNSLICMHHQLTCLYICQNCEHYHVCDGGDECIVINTGESMVCLLTGNCISENVQEFTNLMVKVLNSPQSKYEEYCYQGLTERVKKDLFAFFNRNNENIAEIKEVILNQNSLKPEISKLVDATLGVCSHLFGKDGYGYDLICSMYIQIIISIYSTKTVYNSLLFKCTRNKRYDCVLKRMRELWMSTSVTGDSALKSVST